MTILTERNILFVGFFPVSDSKCASSKDEEKLYKPNKASSTTNLFTCEGSISIRNQAPTSNAALNADHRGVSWCGDKTNSFSNNKSSNNDEYSTLSTQHRNACISISVGVDA